MIDSAGLTTTTISIDFYRAIPQNEMIGAGTVVRFAAAKNGSGRVCMKKDYYLTLRLTPEATEREIRSAYRRLAIEIHPDHSGFGSDPFLELQEAYSVLSDPRRRAVYDREVGEIPVRRSEAARPTKITRRQSVAAFSPLQPIGEPHLASSAPFFPSLTEMVERLWSDFEPWARRKAERPKSLTVDVALSPQETLTGGQVRILVQGRVVCSSCLGQGHAGVYQCSRCQGYGTFRDEYPLVVRYPARLQGDYFVCLSLDDFGSENIYVRFRPARASW
jgi:DnaJ-class molecular chaperone